MILCLNNIEEKKAIDNGEEIEDILDSVLSWVDMNAPQTPRAKGGNFRKAFKVGSEKMKTTQFANLLKEGE